MGILTDSSGDNGLDRKSESVYKDLRTGLFEGRTFRGGVSGEGTLAGFCRMFIPRLYGEGEGRRHPM